MKWPWEKGTEQHHLTPLHGWYYVYLLRFPYLPAVFGIFAGRVFYVGKGSRNRLLAHEKETRSILKSGRMMLLKHKHKTILAIWDAGYDVVQEIIYRTDSEEEAYATENAEMEKYGLERLTNAVYGHRPRNKRAAHFVR